MADFFFFTDSDLLQNQTLQDSYGPLPANPTIEEFKTTSTYSSSTSSNAYAICDGLVLLQNTTNPTLVNLILKPTSLSESNFHNVNFIIYKGIIKSELVDNLYVALNTNDLTTNINESQNLYNLKFDELNSSPVGTTTERPPMQIFGIHIDSTTMPDTDSIQNLFNKSDTYTIPNVKAGWKIGKFDPVQFGIEIVQDRMGFQTKVGVARNLVNSIVFNVNSNPTPNFKDYFDERNSKEILLNFIDPTAFFSDFYENGFYVLDSLNNKTFMKGDILYQDLLVKFHNKNITYLDIRDERNYSFNFFNNYNNSITIDLGSGPQLFNYMRSGWPLLAIDQTEFPPSNVNSKNIISLIFPSGDNSTPRVYLEKARRNSGNPSTTINRIAKGFDSFCYIEVDTNDLSKTSEIKLAIINNNVNSNTLVPCSYNKIKYCKGFEVDKYPLLNDNISFGNNHFLDNIFRPFDFTDVFHNIAIDDLIVSTYYEELYCSDVMRLDFDCILSIGKATDENNITFFGSVINKVSSPNNLINSPIDLGTQKISKQADFVNFLSKHKENNLGFYKKTEVIVTAQHIAVVSLENLDRSSLTNANSINFEDIFFITITKQQFTDLEILKNTAGFYAQSPVFLGLNVIESGYDDNNIFYEKFNLILRGYEVVGSDLKIKQVLSNINIMFYGY